MRVQLQHDESAEHFAKQLLDTWNGKMAIDVSTKCITLPTNFYQRRIDSESFLKYRAALQKSSVAHYQPKTTMSMRTGYS
jgi:hypothetical protein